jgi:hypothetical protein
MPRDLLQTTTAAYWSEGVSTLSRRLPSRDTRLPTGRADEHLAIEFGWENLADSHERFPDTLVWELESHGQIGSK